MNSNQAPRVDIDFRARSFAKDPYPTYKFLRENSPVSQLPDGTYVLTRYDDVLFALKRHDLFSSGWNSAPIAYPEWLRDESKCGAFLAEADPPKHGAYNAVVNKAFMTRAVEDLTPSIRRKSLFLVDEIRKLKGQQIEFFDKFAYPLVSYVIERMTGLNAHTNIERTKIWVEMLESSDQKCPVKSKNPEIDELILDQKNYYNYLINDRRENPCNDLASMLVNAKVHGENLSDSQLHNAFSLFTIGGFEGPAQSLARAMWLLTRRPDLRRLLLEDSTKYSPFIDELLRLHSSAQGCMRKTVKDVVLHNITIPEGSPVLALIGSANRDSSQFYDADRFDIERKNSRSHLSFGSGAHVCIGAALARAEIKIGLETILASFEQFESPPAHELEWYSMPIGRLLRSLPLRLQ